MNSRDSVNWKIKQLYQLSMKTKCSNVNLVTWKSAVFLEEKPDENSGLSSKIMVSVIKKSSFTQNVLIFKE